LALVEGGKRLLVANRDSGTVAVLDTQTLRVTSEVRVGRRLSDLTATADGGLVLTTDEAAGEVILLALREGAPRELRRLKGGVRPVGVRVGDDGRLAAVALLWPRRLTVLDLAAAREAADKPGPDPVPLDLPFAPRRLLPVPGTPQLIVADAFGGRLAVVDLRR